MTYISPIVAHVDWLGYLRCIQCYDADEWISDVAMHADNATIHGDYCGQCGKVFMAEHQIEGSIR